MVKHYIRKLECNRCGQCCGADGGAGFSVNLEEAIKASAVDERGEVVPLTQEMVDEMVPIIGLIGLPMHTGKTSGVVDIDGKKFPYRWLENGRLVRDGSDLLCPFAVYHKDNGPWLCGLVDTSEQWRWEYQCKDFPFRRIIQHMSKAEAIHRGFPKCSYRWRPVDVDV
ncbi:MAG: hypothetical protein ACXAB9_05370 [Candidatus Thorarchaeota archaeon]|jgi:hypothetical protein